MKHWLKKHFIPHEGNDNRPHILRNTNIRKIVYVVLFLEVFTFLIPTLTKINSTGGMAAVLPALLSDLTNDERQSQNLSTLTNNPILTMAAEMKATDMATKSYFAHTSPEGKTPWYWLEKAGYDYQYAGENLAINFSDSKDVTNAWMNSPTHKANIVKDKYTEVGTGIATGLYEGKETVFVAQVYANPAVKEKVLTKLPITSTKKKLPNLSESVGEDPSKTNVLGAEVTNPNSMESENNAINARDINISNPNFLQKMISSPHNTSNFILYIIFGIISISLLLYLVIKMRNHHRRLITNTLIALSIIGFIFVANNYISSKGMHTLENFDYINVNK